MYRIVHCRMWRRGGSFRQLTGPAKPNAQHLWLFLLTGDATTAIPGAISIDKVSLAARLDWKCDAVFERCLNEIEQRSMAEFDWSAGLVWCPGALKYNKPQSPNVVRYWGKAFDVLPECKLKGTIWVALDSYCSELGESYAKAFTEAFPEAFAEGFAEGSYVTVTDTVTDTKKTKKASSKKKGPPKGSARFDEFWEVYPKRTNKAVAVKAWDKALKERRIIAEVTDIGKRAMKTGHIVISALLEEVAFRAANDPQWVRDGGRFIPLASTYLNQSRWTDKWNGIHGRRQAGSDSDPWMYETYRRACYEEFSEHERWAEYIAHAATLSPQSAPPFKEWIKEQGS